MLQSCTNWLYKKHCWVIGLPPLQKCTRIRSCADHVICLHMYVLGFMKNTKVNPTFIRLSTDWELCKLEGDGVKHHLLNNV